MRRIGRWILNGLTVLSLALCVAVVADLLLAGDTLFVQGTVDLWPLSDEVVGTAPFVVPRALDARRTEVNHFGFGWHVMVRPDSTGYRWRLKRELGYPVLLLVIAALALPATRGWLWLRRVRERRLNARGVCLSCRYNLTGNISGVCPECGTAIVRAM